MNNQTTTLQMFSIRSLFSAHLLLCSHFFKVQHQNITICLKFCQAFIFGIIIEWNPLRLLLTFYTFRTWQSYSLTKPSLKGWLFVKKYEWFTPSYVNFIKGKNGWQRFFNKNRVSCTPLGSRKPMIPLFSLNALTKPSRNNSIKY